MHDAGLRYAADQAIQFYLGRNLSSSRWRTTSGTSCGGAGSAHSPTHWVLIILAALLVFNYGYLLALLLVRVLIPRPREGHHPMTTDRRVSRQVRRFMFNVLLAKARYDPPWAAMFSSVLTRIPPRSPRSRAASVRAPGR